MTKVEVEAALFYNYFAINFSESRTSHAPRQIRITKYQQTQWIRKKSKTCTAVTGDFLARHGEQLQKNQA